jgi:hypothetical protein
MGIGNLKANLAGYLGKATQYGREIYAPMELNGAFPVNIQDQVSRALDTPFTKPLIAAPFTTITAKASPGDKTITVASTTSFTDKVVVHLSTADGKFYIGEQVGAPAGNVITLDTPIDVEFPAGSSVFPASHHMNVNGSITTQIFQIGPVGLATGISVDITRIMGYIQSGSAMDDSKFGDLAALTNGIVLRLNNTIITNLWNVKTNGEIALLCFDASASTRAPSGSYGFRFRNTYAGQNKHGVALRLAPTDTLEVLIQDDLSTLQEFDMMAQGHFVTD